MAGATPALVAIDFDGTLLRSDGTISRRTRAAVRAAVGAGVRVLVVTGRPPRWLAPIAELLDHRGTAIAANGALVVDLTTGDVVAANAIAVPVAHEIVGRVRKLFPDAAMGVERPDGFAHERGYPRGIRASERMPEVRYADGDGQLLAEPPIKILVRVGHLDIDAAAAIAIEELAGIASVYWSGSDLLEIAAAGVSKASTLERIAAQWDIGAEDVVAFGDMPNDVPMLTWAGRAVAVANAHPDVHAVADAVTSSNDEDGVAEVLEDLLGR